MYTPHTFRAGANAYARVGVETRAMSASPHQLIVMLFDGVVTTIGMARHHMASGDTMAKGNAISKAISIVDNGLKASLDAKAAGAAGAELVANLSALYDFVIRRLLYANLHHDAKSLDEAEAILENIASAWREVGGASVDN
ncbi:flagellar protein FliS [Variovorax paradoxus]|jgi:flagellar secretion chaperone FliS|uniref:flagellar export chaperone FliS n=1 Tax=Variovorax paradoxus TaxID=34073 RepID=UPI002794AC30|nr:flagellar export chaperone FliS [Variovorax paradoxus]MDQ0568650.1 flagellar protein FliS [Variovorax paradoxus]